MINSAVFIIFAFSFAKPRDGRDWRSFGAFSAEFVIGLFTFGGTVRLTVYGFARLYNAWSQAK